MTAGGSKWESERERERERKEESEEEGARIYANVAAMRAGVQSAPVLP